MYRDVLVVSILTIVTIVTSVQLTHRLLLTILPTETEEYSPTYDDQSTVEVYTMVFIFPHPY